MEFPVFQLVAVAFCPVKQSLVTSLLPPSGIYTHELVVSEPFHAPG